MKRGFTLIELLVSVALLSIVMLFMTNFVVDFRNQKKEANIDINLMTNQAIISKTINFDIVNNVFSSISCESSIKCTITFEDASTKTIEITDNGTSVKYYNGSDIDLVRTISSDTFNEITYSSQTLTDGTFTKIIISLTNNPAYNIEIYDYYTN